MAGVNCVEKDLVFRAGIALFLPDQRSASRNWIAAKTAQSRHPGIHSEYPSPNASPLEPRAAIPDMYPMTKGVLMLTPNPDALEFLLTRRSRPAKTLTGPAPDAEQLQPILIAAARTPDHGKLEPWRFLVLEAPALARLGASARNRGAELGHDAEKVSKIGTMFETAPLSVAVIASPKESAKIPKIEQTLSAGAVCLALLNAALASGWGANWLTGWVAMDRPFLTEALALASHEYVAGFIHIGTETSHPPERPRPDLAAITTWVSA